MKRMERDDRIANLVEMSAIACGDVRPFLTPASFITGDGDVRVVWDTLHGMGFTTRYMKIKHENIPELVSLLMDAYVKQLQEEQQVQGDTA